MLGGVAKWLLARGEGMQLPRGVDEVRLGCECTQENRTLFARREMSHVMGELDEPGLPLHLLPGLDTALRSMRAGERAFFSLSAAAAFGSEARGGPELGGPPHAAAQDAVHCDVELISLTQIEDVSPHADRAVLKTTLVSGRGGETPADGAHVVVPWPTSVSPAPSLPLASAFTSTFSPALNRPHPHSCSLPTPSPPHVTPTLTSSRSPPFHPYLHPDQVRASAYSADGSFLNGTANGTEWQMTLGDGGPARLCRHSGPLHGVWPLRGVRLKLSAFIEQVAALTGYGSP